MKKLSLIAKTVESRCSRGSETDWIETGSMKRACFTDQRLMSTNAELRTSPERPVSEKRGPLIDRKPEKAIGRFWPGAVLQDAFPKADVRPTIRRQRPLIDDVFELWLRPEAGCQLTTRIANVPRRKPSAQKSIIKHFPALAPGLGRHSAPPSKRPTKRTGSGIAQPFSHLGNREFGIFQKHAS